ncbi:MAG: hypothetical protein K2X72_09485 [Reyranella sp.]|nr:hypothetical protein [Reyranella sp.]
MTMLLEADTSAETVVLDCLREGRIAHFETELKDEDRTIRGSFLRNVVVMRLTNVAVAPMSIALENVIVDGELQLTGIGSSTAPLPPLSLTDCEIAGGIDLSDSAWTSVRLDRSRIAGLAASGLRVERNLFLNDMRFMPASAISIDLRDVVVGANFEARNLGRSGGRCRLFLDQSNIGGSVHLMGAILFACGEDRRALSMNGLAVKADLLLNCSDEHRFETDGAVSIVNAEVGGRVSFRGARVDNGAKESLVMDGTRVGGDVLFDEHKERHRFEARGTVCLRGVSVKNSLDFMGAALVGHPDALLLSGAQVDANLILKKSTTSSNCFEAKGAVGLTRVTVGGEVRMQGAKLSGDGELFALYMNETGVRGSVFLCSDGDDRFEAKGLVDLYGVSLDRNLVFNGAKVGQHLDIGEFGRVVDNTDRAWRPHNAEHIPDGPMAVDLRQARILGKALLGVADDKRHTFEARGLICLNGAKIGSELFFRGAQLDNPLDYTVSLNSAEIARDVFFDSSSSFQFKSRGSVSGWGCTIGGGLSCKGALFRQSEPPGLRDRKPAEELPPAMRFNQATIRGEVFLLHSDNDPFVAKGSVLFEHARIEGDLKCDGAFFFGRSKIALSLNDAVITGGVLLKSTEHHRFEGRGVVSLDRAQIGGNLDLTGARLKNMNKTEPVVLRAVDASIGGDVELSADQGRRFKAKGQILFFRTTIKGRLRCRGANLHGQRRAQGYRREEKLPTFSLYGGVVNDKVVMEASKDFPFEARGFVDLSHTRIGAGITCTATHFDNPQGTALSLESAKVMGDVYLTDADAQQPGKFREFRADGDVDLQAVDISGDLSCDGCFRSERYGPDEKDRGKALIFDNGRVSHRWYIRLKRESLGEASLRGGRVGDLDDDGGNNWGPVPSLTRAGDKTQLHGVQLRLDGFTYDRFGPWESPPEPSPGENPRMWWLNSEYRTWWLKKLFDREVPQNIWVARRDWLLRQYPGDSPTREDYFPQPHEQAAQALFTMGHHYDARRLLNERAAHQTRCGADEVLSRFFMKLYRLGFGCGYLPNRALLTVAFWWALGVFATWIALSQKNEPILVKATTGVEIVRSLSDPNARLASPQFVPNLDVRKPDGSIQFRHYDRIDTRDIACTDVDISTLLYPLDTMLPVLDLHMEDKCEVSNEWPFARILKALYAMIGWIIVALAAFTWTGVFRRIPG